MILQGFPRDDVVTIDIAIFTSMNRLDQNLQDSF